MIPINDLKTVIEVLESLFDKGLIEMSSLVYILEELEKKYPEEPSLLPALSRYKILFEKYNECLTAIESGRENAPLEKELVWDDVCKLYEGLFKENNITNTKLWPKIDVQGSDAVKWYDHDIDMTKLSEKHPTIRFELYGEGEEHGDVWKTIFLGGKVKYLLAELVWPDEDSVGWV